MKNNILNLLLGLFLFVGGSSCNSHSNQETNEINSLDWNAMSNFLEDVELEMKKFDFSHEKTDFDKLVEYYSQLEFSYDEDEIPEEHRSEYKQHEFKVDSMRIVLGKMLEAALPNYPKQLLNKDDHLLSQTETNPLYLKRGEKVYINFETQGSVTMKFYNADSHALLKTYTGKKMVHDSLNISNTAVYLLELTPKGNQYVELNVQKTVSNLDEYVEVEKIIGEKMEECSAKDFGARKIQGIKLKPVFEEPRKITLRSQGKAFFSGGSRTVVAMQVPTGCTDIAYSLRISTSQEDENNDGQFCNKMNEKYKEIKFLGLPLYESHGSSSSLFRELLNACEPPREEEAYCNLYVFKKSAEAKKFSDGAAVSTLKYDVDYSKNGTQSCNDRIPVKPGQTIYFGFENTRIRYSVYLWLESIATVSQSEYFKTVYTVE